MAVLEIAVTSAAGARAACRAGADRVELCAALELGGLTPSAGLLETALESVGDDPRASWRGVHALIRPRPGDFVYDADDLATAVREVRAVIGAGAAGVVVGALTGDGMVDEDALAALAGAAQDVDPATEVTFHRALDQTTDIFAAFSAILAGGRVDRVLTSGGKPAAGQALAELNSMVRMAEADRVQVMAGGGVQLDDIAALLGTGVDAVHLSAKKRVSGAGGRVALGAADTDPGAFYATDEAIVSAASAMIR